MIHVRLAVLATAAILWGACGTRTNPDFCCSSAASCLATGTDVGVTTCDDPDRSFCDDDGTYGTPRTCVVDPSSTDCDTPADCTNPDRPLCIDNRCVECNDGTMCDNPTPACAPTHLCVACTGPTDCDGDPGGPACVEGACVECAGPADCPSVDEPFCEPSTHTCRGCRVDSECGAAGVCDRDSGICTPAGELLYAAPGATGTTCTSPAPPDVCTLTRALQVAAGAAARRTIKLAPGTYNESAVIIGGAVVLHGAGPFAGGTEIMPGNADGVAVSGGANVTVEDLRITNASGPVAPNAVRCTGNTSTLTLRRTNIDANPGGGVGITGCSFSLVNNFITRNGGTTSFFGGVSLSMLPATGAYTFAFNTVANNTAPMGNIAGIACVQLNAPVRIQNSIVYGNEVPPGAPEIGTDSDCAANNSIVGDAAPGATNLDADPRFLAPSDFHIGPTSPAVGLAAATPPLDHDVDRDLRPLPVGTVRDSGADELAQP